MRENDPVLLKVQAPFDNLQVIANGIEDLYKIPRGSNITAEIKLLQLRRRNALTGIRHLILGYTYSTDILTKKYADLLAESLSDFSSKITGQSYNGESALIRAFIANWNENPSLSAALTALSLNGWMTEIETANNLFSERYITRSYERSLVSPGNIGTIKAKRLEADLAYYELRKHLDAGNTIHNGADPFGKTVNSINALVKKYRLLLNRRGVDDVAPPAI